jgi:hypothetical protein
MRYEVRRPVFDRQTAVVIDYTAGGDDYRLTISSGIVICPPPITSNRCTSTAADR